MAEERAGEYLISPKTAVGELVKFLPHDLLGPVGGEYIFDNSKLSFQAAKADAEIATQGFQVAYTRKRNKKGSVAESRKYAFQQLPFPGLLLAVAGYGSQLPGIVPATSVEEVRDALINGAIAEEAELQRIKNRIAKPSGRFKRFRSPSQVDQGIAALASFHEGLSMRASRDPSSRRRI